MRAYKHFVFDLYGTLADIHTDESRPALWRAMAERFASEGAAYSPRELRESYLGICAELTAKADSPWPDIRIPEVFARLYGEKSVSPGSFAVRETALEFRRLSTTHLRLYAGAKELLSSLRDAGRGVYLLSHAQRLWTEAELRSLGLLDLFDDIVISSDYGCCKPDPRLFRVLLERNGLDPADCLMIGNDPAADIRGAAGAGMDGYFIRSALTPRNGPAPEVGAVCIQNGTDLSLLRRRLLPGGSRPERSRP